MYESHGRSTSSGPEDWPALALRRSAAMQRYSPLNSSIALKGLRQCGDRRVQSPAGNEQQREAGTGLLIVDANGALFVEGHGSFSCPSLLSEHARALWPSPSLRGPFSVFCVRSDS